MKAHLLRYFAVFLPSRRQPHPFAGGGDRADGARAGRAERRGVEEAKRAQPRAGRRISQSEAAPLAHGAAILGVIRGVFVLQSSRSAHVSLQCCFAGASRAAAPPARRAAMKAQGGVICLRRRTGEWVGAAPRRVCAAHTPPHARYAHSTRTDVHARARTVAWPGRLQLFHVNCRGWGSPARMQLFHLNLFSFDN